MALLLLSLDFWFSTLWTCLSSSTISLHRSRSRVKDVVLSSCFVLQRSHSCSRFCHDFCSHKNLTSTATCSLQSLFSSSWGWTSSDAATAWSMSIDCVHRIQSSKVSYNFTLEKNGSLILKSSRSCVITDPAKSSLDHIPLVVTNPPAKPARRDSSSLISVGSTRN